MKADELVDKSTLDKQELPISFSTTKETNLFSKDREKVILGKISQNYNI